jgi:UDP-GlcNAc:undecaprenyl-phosphate/decaprenyl-phosphate GlcNAc-1-phosphate transferase
VLSNTPAHHSCCQFFEEIFLMMLQLQSGYIPLLMLVFFSTVGLLTTLKAMAPKVGLTDTSDWRKLNSASVPLVGGLAIFSVVAITALLVPEIATEYRGVLMFGGLILFIGLLDDLYNLGAWKRLLLQMICVLAMCVVTGLTVTSLGDIAFIGSISLGFMAIPFTAFATVGVVNATNMIDGLDGLASGLCVIAFSMLTVVALTSHQGDVVLLKPVLISSLLAFMLLNCGPLRAKGLRIFLGDAGSTFMGFMVCWLLITSSQGADAVMAPVTALWFFAIPLLDILLVVATRMMQRRSLFSASRDHLHHRLINAGYSERQSLVIILGAAVMFGLVGLAGHFGGAPDGVMFAGFILLFAVFAVKSKKMLRRSADSPMVY